MSDLRGDIATALEGWLTPEQLSALLDEILAIKKSARGWCGTCKKHVVVEISDPKAVVSAMADLANQGFGRPTEASGADDDRIVFKRLVKLEEDGE
jgi:hypothetical protein